jgi:hypothetical protein
VRLSEFRFAVEHEFGAGYGHVVTHDLVLEHLGGRSVEQALEDGVSPRDAWLAICAALDVPEARRHGAGRPAPRS